MGTVSKDLQKEEEEEGEGGGEKDPDGNLGEKNKTSSSLPGLNALDCRASHIKDVTSAAKPAIKAGVHSCPLTRDFSTFFVAYKFAGSGYWNK